MATPAPPDPLPPPEDQQALTAELRALLGVRGQPEFLHAPLVRATPEFFPDQWRADLAGATVMLHRMLALAGLGGLPTRVVLDDADGHTQEQVEAPRPPGHDETWSGAAAWFAGRVDGALLFGVFEAELDDAEQLAGVLAHEVAHAWRLHHGLLDEDPDVEEELTDLTAVVLGFGVLVTNNAWRLRRSQHLEGAAIYSRTRTTRTGYLPPGALAWVVGLQLAVRRSPAAEVRQVLAALEPMQREVVQRAHAGLEGEAASRELGLPPPSQWPGWRPPTLPQTRSLPPAVARPLPPPAGLIEAPPAIAFRVRTGLTAPLFVLSLVVGLLLCIPAGSWWPALLPGVAALKRRWWPAWSCSSTRCYGGLSADSERCGACGARIVGAIDERRDRFDAERDYLRRTAERDALEEDLALESEALEEPPRDQP